LQRKLQYRSRRKARISLSKEAKIRISQSMGNVWPWYAGNDIQPLAGLNDIFACGKNDITAAP
jgi:hypothetical protein